MKPMAKLFISSDTAGGIFGDGKYRLLAAVRDQGSIQDAARSLGRSYRKAWGDILVAEKGFGRALVVRSRGGRSGGSTVLTDFGERLLKEWERYRKAVDAAMARTFKRSLGTFLVEVEK